MSRASSHESPGMFILPVCMWFWRKIKGILSLMIGLLERWQKQCKSWQPSVCAFQCCQWLCSCSRGNAQKSTWVGEFYRRYRIRAELPCLLESEGRTKLLYFFQILVSFKTDCNTVQFFAINTVNGGFLNRQFCLPWKNKHFKAQHWRRRF